jgi:hypothetical protein
VQHTLQNPFLEGKANKKERKKMQPLILGGFNNRRRRLDVVKKLTLALLIAAVVNVPVAEAILIPLAGGGLQSGVPYIFRISADVTDVAVRLQAVVRSRLELEENLTVPAGAIIDLDFTIPSRANQVILVLDPAMIGFDPQNFGNVTMTILDQNLVPIIPSLTFTDPHIEVVCQVAP